MFLWGRGDSAARGMPFGLRRSVGFGALVHKLLELFVVLELSGFLSSSLGPVWKKTWCLLLSSRSAASCCAGVWHGWHRGAWSQPSQVQQAHKQHSFMGVGDCLKKSCELGKRFGLFFYMDACWILQFIRTEDCPPGSLRSISYFQAGFLQLWKSFPLSFLPPFFLSSLCQVKRNPLVSSSGSCLRGEWHKGRRLS